MRINFILIMAVLMFSSFCYADQYYKFVDKNGVVTFTDDISKIPKDQRAKIEINKAVKSKPQDAQVPASEGESAKEAETEQPDVALKTSQELDKEAEELKRIKAELDKEAEEINSESMKLIEENKNLTDNKSIKEYNAKIEQMNEKTKAYQLKQVEYVKRANDYNSRAAAAQPPAK